MKCQFNQCLPDEVRAKSRSHAQLTRRSNRIKSIIVMLPRRGKKCLKAVKLKRWNIALCNEVLRWFAGNVRLFVRTKVIAGVRQAQRCESLLGLTKCRSAGATERSSVVLIVGLGLRVNLSTREVRLLTRAVWGVLCVVKVCGFGGRLGQSWKVGTSWAWSWYTLAYMFALLSSLGHSIRL